MKTTADKDNAGNESFADNYHKLIERTDAEINRVHETYKLYAYIIAGILGVSFISFSVLYYGKISEMRESIDQELSNMKYSVDQELSKLTQDIDSKRRELDTTNKEISNELNRVDSNMRGEVDYIKKQLDIANKSIDLNIIDAQNRANERIDKNFNDDQIRNIIEKNVVTKINEIADPIIESKIQKRTDQVANEIVQKKLEPTKKSIMELQKLSDFLITDTAAKSDDRLAFEQLRTWSEDNTCPYQKEAKKSYYYILNTHRQLSYKSNLIVSYDPSKKPQPNLQSMLLAYSKEQSFIRPFLIYTFWRREDIPEKTRVQFLIYLIEKDPSLKSVEIASGLLVESFNLNLVPLATRSILAEMKNRGFK